MRRAVLPPKHVGEALLRFRRKAGWTQEDLSQKTRINVSSISRYEQGKNRIGRVNLKKLCTAFACSPEHFLNYAWGISEEESGGARRVVTAEFPTAELERIYDEFASEKKSLYLRTCRALYDTLLEAIVSAPRGNALPPKAS
jgi:transcriptional regulator with XRE-family HTH domain